MDGQKLASDIHALVQIAKLARDDSLSEGLAVEEARVERRREAAVVGGQTPIPMARVESVQIPGPAGSLDARLYVPTESPPSALLVYYHGGGWVIGDLETHDRPCRFLAANAGAQVLAVDYRLAPEHPFPAAVDDSWTALQWVGEHAVTLGGDPARIAVAGDSAGANLSAVVAHLARDNGGPALAFQLLWYPVTTGDLSLPSFLENADAPVLDRDVIEAFLGWYLPDVDISDPRTLPVTLAPANAADFAGLPPAYIGTAEHDPLRDDGARYAELLGAAGVPAELRNEPTMVHGFVNVALAVPAAAEATERGLAALKAALH